MQLIMSIFVFVIATVPMSNAFFDLHSANGRLLRGHMEAKIAVESNSTQDSDSFKSLGRSCKCQFSGLCSCVQALEFMKCIRDACDSGACDCQKHHYFYACHSMSAECPNAELQCKAQDATCKKVPPMVTESAMELVSDIEVMQSRKCKLEEAVSDGFINGKVRLAEIEPEIQDRTDELSRKGIATPKLGCQKEDTESFTQFKTGLQEQMEKEQAQLSKLKSKVSKLEAKVKRKQRKHKEVKQEVIEKAQKMEDDDEEERSGEGQQQQPAEQKVEQHPRWRKSDSPWRGKENMPETDVDLFKAITGAGQEPRVGEVPSVSVSKPQVPATTSSLLRWWLDYLLVALVNIGIAAVCALIYNRYRLRAKHFVAPKPVALQQLSQDDMGVGLFSCFGDVKLTAFACCCPCLRWADTLDKAGLLKYWAAFTVFIVLVVLSPITFGISGVALIFVCFRYRQRLRKKYNVEPNDGQDLLAYLCCGTCAVVQEARVEANRVG